MKIFISLILLIFVFFSYSQKNNNIVIYEFSYEFNDNIRLSNDSNEKTKEFAQIFKQMMIQIGDFLERSEIILTYNDTLSYSNINKGLDQESNDGKFLNFEFFNLSEKLYYKKSVNIYYDELKNDNVKYLVIKDAQKRKWEIKEEIKFINGYKCKLATLIENDKQKIDLWFAEELKYNFGPGLFSGLPGLILEVNVKDLTFGYSYIITAKKIEEIQNHELNIPKLPVITSKEYLELLKKGSLYLNRN